MDKITSIIITHWSQNESRSKMMKDSVTSLLQSVSSLPCEIIIVHNGPIQDDDNDFFVNLLKNKMITHYILNQGNLSFGIARNQGYSCASGEYICIADNDILYKNGWLESCLHILEKYPRKKLYASCIEYPTGFMKERYDVGKLDDYNLNMRAGSNCFVIRRDYYDQIGGFVPHRIAGTKWTDRAVKLGFHCAVSPIPLCEDMGIRDGYAHNTPVPFKKILTNWDAVYLNRDEYKNTNPNLRYA